LLVNIHRRSEPSTFVGEHPSSFLRRQESPWNSPSSLQALFLFAMLVDSLGPRLREDDEVLREDDEGLREDDEVFREDGEVLHQNDVVVSLNINVQ
jgi:hypothetical protein